MPVRLNIDPIEIGDAVEIIHTGKTYDLFSLWTGLRHYESHFVRGKKPETGHIYRVLNIKPHDTFRHIMLALIQNHDTTQVFIIDITSLKKVGGCKEWEF